MGSVALMQAAPYGPRSRASTSDSHAARFFRIDPLLLLAALGLIACSVYTIAIAHRGRHRRATPTTT